MGVEIRPFLWALGYLLDKTMQKLTALCHSDGKQKGVQCTPYEIIY